MILVNLNMALRGEASCGCFGMVPVNPWYTVALDCAALIALFTWRPANVSQPRTSRGVRFALLAMAALVLSGTGVVALAWHGSAGREASEQVVVVRSDGWVGQPFPLLPHLVTEVPITQGKWTIVFFNSHCPVCHEYLHDCERNLREDERRRMILVEVPTEIEGALPGFSVARLPRDRTWFVEVPLRVDLHDGLVTAVHDRAALAAQHPVAVAQRE